jgi:tetratricopeptide (TPR) repeat protein
VTPDLPDLDFGSLFGGLSGLDTEDTLQQKDDAALAAAGVTAEPSEEAPGATPVPEQAAEPLEEAPETPAAETQEQPAEEPPAEPTPEPTPETPAETPPAETPPEQPAPDAFAGFDTAQAPADTGSAGSAEAGQPGDAFDSFNLGEEEPPPEEDENAPDDIFNDALLQQENVEEINLSPEEFANIQKTLDSYPLNLRMACEEIIAEKVVAPEQLSALLRMLTDGSPARQTAEMAGRILGENVPVVNDRQTAAELEVEQSTFKYQFIHRGLPVLLIALMIASVLGAIASLCWRFVYIPAKAGHIYELGYEQIAQGNYSRANERFNEAFAIKRIKEWFYRYAAAFAKQRQYLYAEQKYDQLLGWYPQDKQGTLAYANMETTELRNYPKAEKILYDNLLNYQLNDKDGILALGDNYLAWAEAVAAGGTKPGTSEDEDSLEDLYNQARLAYAQLLERYGWKDDIVSRMLRYFIDTDNLAQVISLQNYFAPASNHKISGRALSELGGYLLDKLEQAGANAAKDQVPDANVQNIRGLRALLLRAVKLDPNDPEPHYELARYYASYGLGNDVRITLENAIQRFDKAGHETPKRSKRRIDAELRYVQVLINAKEFFNAESEAVKTAGIYQDAVARQVIKPQPAFAKVYADLGDLEYFVKSNDMNAAINYYQKAVNGGYATPEVYYRMGAAYYAEQNWSKALDTLYKAYTEGLDMNGNVAGTAESRRLLYALGNAAYQKGDNYAAQGDYALLMQLLNADLSRITSLSNTTSPGYTELAIRLMVTRNNLAAALENLAERSGSKSMASQAQGYYALSSSAWDVLTRNPTTMVRAGAGKLSTPGINLAYLNSRNALYPQNGYKRQIYSNIDKDLDDPSVWEDLVRGENHLSGQL